MICYGRKIYYLDGRVTLLRQHCQCFLLWTNASGFCGKERYFLPGHRNLHGFRKNVPICNKICSSSEVTGFSPSKAALLSLNKAFSYHFSMRQRAKCINFKEMTAVPQALPKWIETFKGSLRRIFDDNFAIVNGLQRNSINGEVMEPLQRIAMLCREYNIELQAHWISTKQNSLADMLSRGQYTKIANKYSSLQIVTTTFGIPLKAQANTSLYALVRFGKLHRILRTLWETAISCSSRKTSSMDWSLRRKKAQTKNDQGIFGGSLLSSPGLHLRHKRFTAIRFYKKLSQAFEGYTEREIPVSTGQ